MTFASEYEVKEPSRSKIDQLQGPALLEFGSPGCGFCLRAEPLIREALAGLPNMRHIRIADGRGKRLGRSFRVKLWPTLVFLKDGKEVSRLVRPAEPLTSAARSPASSSTCIIGAAGALRSSS